MSILSVPASCRNWRGVQVAELGKSWRRGPISGLPTRVGQGLTGIPPCWLQSGAAAGRLLYIVEAAKARPSARGVAQEAV